MSDFLHGVETVTVDDGSGRPITTARSSVIFLPYIAPTADDTLFPYDTPMLFTRRSNYTGMGSTGTGRRALDGIFDQIGALVVGVRCKEGTNDGDQFAKIIGGTNPDGSYFGSMAARAAEAVCGVAPMLMIAPGFTHQRPVGVATVTMTDQGDTPYTTATVVFQGGNPVIPATGTPIIANGKITGIQMNFLGLGYATAPTAVFSGDGTGAAATVTLGASANPVAQSLLGLANSMRAHVIVDGPSTTDADALTARGDFGSRRIFFVDPMVSGFSTADGTYAIEPVSARVAGLIAQVDNNEGFWTSPSNHEIVGIGGLARPIDYAFGAFDSRANILNSNQIATIIRDDGYLLWGNRTCSTDEKYAFLSISRSCDLVDISIAKAHRYAVDKGITKGYYDSVMGNVNQYFRTLKKQGSIIDGKCWVDPDKNTPDQIEEGHVTFSYDFSGIYPAERVTFESTLTDTYLTEIFSTT